MHADDGNKSREKSNEHFEYRYAFLVKNGRKKHLASEDYKLHESVTSLTTDIKQIKKHLGLFHSLHL